MMDDNNDDNHTTIDLNIFDQMVASAASIIVPESLSLEGVEKWGANNNNNNNNKTWKRKPNVNIAKKNIAMKKHPIVKVGDIILTRTPGAFMSIARDMANNPFDHAVVVVENNMVVHVSPPQVRLLPLHIILEEKRSPLLLRPMLKNEEMQIFITNVKSAIGKRYNTSRAIALLSRIVLEQQFDIKSTKPLSNKKATLLSGGAICTDLVLSCLCKASDLFHHTIFESELSKELDYIKQGSASFMDLVRLNRYVPKHLRYYPLKDVQANNNMENVDEKTTTTTIINGNTTDKKQLPDVPKLFSLDDNDNDVKDKNYTKLQDMVETFSIPFQQVALSYLNRYRITLPDKRFEELISIDVLEELPCKGNCIYGHRVFTMDTTNSFPSILNSIIGHNQTNAIFHEECIFNFEKKELTIVTYNSTYTSYCNLYSRIVIKETENSNNTNTNSLKQCILRETGQISAHGIPYLLQSTVKSFLSGGAIKNHHRTIEMLNDRLKHFVYKYNEKSKKIFFVNEMGVFDDKDTDLSNNDNGRVQHRSRL